MRRALKTHPVIVIDVRILASDFFYLANCLLANVLVGTVGGIGGRVSEEGLTFLQMVRETSIETSAFGDGEYFSFRFGFVVIEESIGG